MDLITKSQIVMHQIVVLINFGFILQIIANSAVNQFDSYCFTNSI